MAGQSSQDVLKQTVDSFATRVSQYADGIAGRLGQPLSGTQLSQDEAVARWNFTPLGSTQAADAQYHQLVASGMAPGQALAQVYPMRQMLYHGASLQDQIKTAEQIQGWAADASGQPVPPKPEGSTLPFALAQQAQQRAAALSPPVAAGMAAALSGPGTLPAPPAGPAMPPLAVGPALPPLPPGPAPVS